MPSHWDEMTLVTLGTHTARSRRQGRSLSGLGKRVRRGAGTLAVRAESSEDTHSGPEAAMIGQGAEDTAPSLPSTDRPTRLVFGSLSAPCVQHPSPAHAACPPRPLPQGRGELPLLCAEVRGDPVGLSSSSRRRVAAETKGPEQVHVPLVPRGLAALTLGCQDREKL